jgi:hypothetical protein
MSTSVKMSEEGKRLLDKLQARFVITTGEKISQQELLDTLVKFSSEREDELFGLITGVQLPLPPGEIEKLMEMPTDWGIETREEEIDTHLYGGKGGKPAETTAS